ncbi:hypothetical protein [Nostoc sp. MS1]|uniref:hypothetical protein n=1 Tax=Nostoc sp. MS1 TaxID=2764711 RepID=UPI001CC62760|nr:hypothetical protein [Nostoc sp. MS1]BCL36948.1 hypothetical protein NSMS1_33950 [Nostoc sp. MS1]
MSWHQINSCKNYLLTSLGVGIAVLTWSQAATLAQINSTFAPTEIYQLAAPQRLTIPPIAQSEISLTTKSESVASQGDLFTPPQFNTAIVREFPNIWQMRVPIDQVSSLYAVYELKAENGNGSSVSSEQHSSSTVPVVIEPLPIMEISRDINSNTVLVQGGFRLKMDITNTQVAGVYNGELTVVVDRR